MLNKYIYKKNFFIFLSIVILYTVLVLGVMGVKSYQSLSQNNDYMNSMYISKASDEIDYKFGVALQYVENIVRKESVMNYLNDNSNNYSVISNVYDDLVTDLNSINQLGFKVGLTKFSDNAIVSSNGYFAYQDYIKYINLHGEKLSNPLYLFMGNPSSYYFVPKEMETDTNSFTIIKKFNALQSDNDLFVFVTFNRNTLLPDYLPNDIGHFTIWIENSNNSFASFASKDYRDFQYHPKDFQDTQKMDGITYSKSNSEINYSITSNTLEQLKYSYVIHKHDFVRLNDVFFKDLILPYLILILVGACIVYFATKKSYSPIQFIMNSINRHNDVKPLITNDKKFNELDYIVNIIDKVNLKNVRLQENFDRSLSSLQENFFKNLIYHLYTDEDISQSFETLSLESYKDGGILSILSLEGISEIESHVTKDNLILLRKKLLRMFSHMNPDIKFVLVSLDYKKFCLIFSEKNMENVTEILNQMIGRLEDDLSIDLTFTIAQPVDAIENFHAAFNEACALTNEGYLYLDTKIISANSKAILRDEMYTYPLDTERFLINAIHNKDLEKARKILTEILHKNFKELELDVYNVIECKHAFLNTVKRILNSHDNSILGFSTLHQPLFQDLTSNQPEKLYHTFLNIFEILFKEYILSDNYLANPTITNILHYIHEHHTEDLSLTMIADHFHLTEGYISKLLKEGAKVNFKNYLNTLKVKKATELLMTGNYKVNEVSCLVGYKNVNTFIRMFKRYEGVSPGEYKKLKYK